MGSQRTAVADLVELARPGCLRRREVTVETESVGRPRRGFALAIGAIGLSLLSSCSASDGAAGAKPTLRATTSTASSSTSAVAAGEAGRPGSVESSTTLVVKPGDREARVAVDAIRVQLPYPDDVVACVVAEVSADSKLLASARGAKARAGDLDTMVGVGARCSLRVRAAPLFGASLQEQAGGSLTKEQVACAVKGYSALDPAVVERVTAAALNPESAEPGASKPVDDLVKRCGIVVERAGN